MNFGRRVVGVVRQRSLPFCSTRVGLIGIGGGVALCGTWTANNHDSSSSANKAAWPLGRPAYANTVGDHSPGAGATQDDTRKIIFAFDTTDASEFAFDWALQHVFRADDLVLLLNVRSLPQSSDSDFSDVAFSQAKLQEIERLDRVHYELSEARGKKFEEACEKKGINCRSVHAMGNPAVTIVDVAHDQDSDCIVLGTHDRGALGRLTIGGVPTYVVHNAHCPVIVARKKSQDASKHEAPPEVHHRRVESWNDIQNNRARHKASHDGRWRDSESLWNMTRHGATRH